MKSLKKKRTLKAFTLVELIVVIAIIGVLAVMLIPNMLGRVREARLTTANDTAAKIAEQTRIAISDLDAAGTSYSGSSLIAGLTAEDTDALAKAVIAAVPEAGDSKASVTVKVTPDASHVYVIYAKDSETPYVGLYPKPDDYKYDGSKKASSYSISGKGNDAKASWITDSGSKATGGA